VAEGLQVSYAGKAERKRKGVLGADVENLERDDGDGRGLQVRRFVKAVSGQHSYYNKLD